YAARVYLPKQTPSWRTMLALFPIVQAMLLHGTKAAVRVRHDQVAQRYSTRTVVLVNQGLCFRKSSPAATCAGWFCREGSIHLTRCLCVLLLMFASCGAYSGKATAPKKPCKPSLSACPLSGCLTPDSSDGVENILKHHRPKADADKLSALTV